VNALLKRIFGFACARAGAAAVNAATAAPPAITDRRVSVVMGSPPRFL